MMTDTVRRVGGLRCRTSSSAMRILSSSSSQSLTAPNATCAAPPSATILFVCRGNSVRSKIAAAFAERLLGGRAVILSAGTAPKAAIKAGVQQVMEDLYRLPLKGVPTPVSAYKDEAIDAVVTLSEEEPDPAMFSVRAPKMVRWRVEPPSEAIGALRGEQQEGEVEGRKAGGAAPCSACELSDSASHAKAVYMHTASRIERLVEEELPLLLQSL